MKIQGEIEGIKRNVLESFEESLSQRFGNDFIPEVLADILLEFTKLTKKEILVYLTRNGTVLDAFAGTSESVMAGSSPHRNRKIRCIHTHPGTFSHLSQLDISFLRTGSCEAISAIAHNERNEIRGSFIYGDEEPSDVQTNVPIQSINSPEIFSRIDQAYRSTDDKLETISKVETYVLAGSDNSDLKELKSLVLTAGGKTKAVIRYNAHKNKSQYYIGEGKLKEITELIQNNQADGVIFDDELKASQIRNIEKVVNAKILDRTMLILDIFAGRAKSKEGKLQVLLAQLKYRQTHLTGKGVDLSRLGGGIGTRGPGETKLETDKRHIRTQIKNIEIELDKIRKTRNMHRQTRIKRSQKSAVLVGYTNSGKSTLLNALTDSDVYVENKLFATLDTTTRKLKLDKGRHILLSDTVGFINKLPHELIDAFKATLEEVQFADLLIMVLDSKDPNMLNHQKVTYEILKEIGASDIPIITVLNKTDLSGNDIDRRIYLYKEYKTRYAYLSALKKTGLDELIKSIDETLFKPVCMVKESIDYDDGGRISYIHDNFKVISEKYEGEKVTIEYEKTQN